MISRTENFLIGIVFAMVRMLLEMKGIPDHDIEGYGNACQRAYQRENGHGVQPFVQFNAPEYTCGDDEQHLECQTRIAGIAVQRPGVLGSPFRGLRHFQ